MLSFLNVITLKTYIFFITLTLWLHGRSKRFVWGLLWPLAGAWARLLRFVFTRRSAFFELSYPRTHIFHVHNAIIACLTQLLMNSDGFHATQMEESDNHVLFFELNVAIEVSKTLLSLDDVTSIQRVGQCCHLVSSNLKNSHAIYNNFHVSICFHSRETN